MCAILINMVVKQSGKLEDERRVSRLLFRHEYNQPTTKRTNECVNETNGIKKPNKGRKENELNHIVMLWL